MGENKIMISRMGKLYLSLFLITWIPWSAALFSGLDVGDVSVNILIALGGTGPLIAALYGINILWKNDWISKGYLKRIFGFRRLSTNISLFILLFQPLVLALSYCIAYLMGQESLPLRFELNREGGLWAILVYVVFILFFGPVPEELCWRGICLDLLNRRFGRTGSSLMLGLIWGVWHIPLFLIHGTYQNTAMTDPLGLFLFFVTIIPNTFILTWLYYKSNRLILTAILYHFMINFIGSFIDTTRTVQLLQLALIALAVICLFIFDRDFWSGKLSNSYAESDSGCP